MHTHKSPTTLNNNEFVTVDDDMRSCIQNEIYIYFLNRSIQTEFRPPAIVYAPNRLHTVL